MKSPKIGLIVLFALAASRVEAINDQRARSEGALRGNAVSIGQIVPLVVTQVWSDEMINGTALLDGNDTLWVTSVHHSASPREGTWHFQCDQATPAEASPADPSPEAEPVPLPDVALVNPGAPIPDTGTPADSPPDTSVSFSREELQALNDEARSLCDAIEALPASQENTALSLKASNVLHAINRRLFPIG